MARPCGVVRLAIMRAAEGHGRALTARELVDCAGVDRRAGLIAVENLVRTGALVATGSRRVPWRRARTATYTLGVPRGSAPSAVEPGADSAHQLGAFLRRAWRNAS